MKDLLTEALLPVIPVLSSILIPIILAFAFDRFRKWTGMEIEARHREALQSALANAAAKITAGATRQSGVAYVLQSVPDALKAFGIDSDTRIAELLDPHLARKAERKND